MVMIEKDLGYFSASHQLPQHNGLCKNLHGHNYHVEIAVMGDLIDEGSKAGMVMDFSDLKKIYLREICDIVDHSVILGKNWPSWYLRFMDGLVPSNETEGQMTVRDLADALLGKVAHLPIPETTAEYMAVWMHDVMQKALREAGYAVTVAWVRVWETETSWAQSIK